MAQLLLVLVICLAANVVVVWLALKGLALGVAFRAIAGFVLGGYALAVPVSLIFGRAFFLLSLLTTGPALPAILFALYAPLAPSVSAPALLVGVVVAAVLVILAATLTLRHAPNLKIEHWALLLPLAVFAAIYLSAEVTADLSMRAQAERQFPAGYCMVQRRALLDMAIRRSPLIPFNECENSCFPHATLVDGRSTWDWSFKEMAWAPGHFVHRNPSLEACQ